MVSQIIFFCRKKKSARAQPWGRQATAAGHPRPQGHASGEVSQASITAGFKRWLLKRPRQRGQPSAKKRKHHKEK